MLFIPIPPVQEVAPLPPQTVVTAPRSEQAITSTAAKVTVVTGEELEQTGERSLPRALSQAAGVWVQESNLGGGAPVVRGLLGNQILIVVDGVRLNDSTTRFGPNQSLNTIDPAIVDRIEVIHGSSSVLYGSDAIGGVILVWTKRRTPAGQGGDSAVHGGFSLEYSTAIDGGRASDWLSGASESFGWLGVLSAANYHDLEGANGERQPFTGYHSNSAFGTLETDLGDARNLRFSAMVHRDFDVPRTFQLVPGFGRYQAPFEQYDFKLQERERYQWTFDDRSDGGFADRMQARLSVRRYNEQRDRRRTGSDTQIFEDMQVETIGLGADWRKAVGEGHLLTYGFDFDRDEVDSFRIDTDRTTGDTQRRDGMFAPNARYSGLGAFLQDEIIAWAPTFVTLGLRYSYFDFAFDDTEGPGRIDGDFDALTASVEAAHELDEGTRVAATLAQGFQAPNLDDLANDGDFAGGIEEANPDLDPADSLMAELALELTREAWSGAAAVFGTRIDDYIGRNLIDEGDPNVDGDETYQRANAGRVELWGIELTGRHRLGEEGSPWAVQGVTSIVRGRQFDKTLDPDGVDLRRVPPWNGRIGLLWNRPRVASAGLDSAQLSFSWADQQDKLHPEDASDPRIDPRGTDGWGVVDLDFAGPLAERVRWNISLVNLLDEDYRVHGSAVNGAGRSLVVGISASF